MAETALDGAKKELSIAYEDTHATPAASEGILYFKTDGVPYAKSADMSETDLTGGSAAPVGATYITQTANGTLTNEQALSTEPTGDLMVTTTTGVLNSIKHNLAASVAPDANDDSGDGYEVGSRWIDTTADKSYQCVDATLTAAVWNNLSVGNVTTTRGDIIRRGASVDERLALGAANTYLMSDGTDVIARQPVRAESTLNLGADLTTTSATFVDTDATNLSLTMTTNGGDVLVSFHCYAEITAGSLYFEIDVDGSPVAGNDGIIRGIAFGQSLGCIYSYTRKIAGLSAASHTFKIQWKISSGTATLFAGAGTANKDIHPQFWVLEV